VELFITSYQDFFTILPCKTAIARFKYVNPVLIFVNEALYKSGD